MLGTCISKSYTADWKLYELQWTHLHLELWPQMSAMIFSPKCKRAIKHIDSVPLVKHLRSYGCVTIMWPLYLQAVKRKLSLTKSIMKGDYQGWATERIPKKLIKGRWNAWHKGTPPKKLIRADRRSLGPLPLKPDSALPCSVGQAMFCVRSLEYVPHCVPYASLCLESGEQRLEVLAWIRFFKFWEQICYYSFWDILLQALLSDLVLPLG